MPRLYSTQDLTALNAMGIGRLHTTLTGRLAPGAHLNHRMMCRFFQALVPKPADAAAFAVQYPGLAGKVTTFLALAATDTLLKTHFGSFDNKADLLANQFRNTGNVNPTGPVGIPPDALTEAIKDNCEHCVGSLFHCGIFAPGMVFNQHGWALLSVALWTGSLEVLTLLTTLSGGNPGPLAECSISPAGFLGNPIITMAGNIARADLMQPLMNWCDTFMGAADARVAGAFAAVPAAKFKMLKMGSAATAAWMMGRGVDISVLVDAATGDTPWHVAARFDRNVVGGLGFLTWLKGASPGTIINRNIAGNTPLETAIFHNNDYTVPWFAANLTVAEIKLVNPAPANAALTTALDLVLSSSSETSVSMLSDILACPAYIGTRTVTASIEARLELLINELRRNRNSQRGAMDAGTLSEWNFQKWWKEAKRTAGKKCQLLVAHAPASFFVSDEIKYLKELARGYQLGQVVIPNFENSAGSSRSLRDR